MNAIKSVGLYLMLAGAVSVWSEEAGQTKAPGVAGTIAGSGAVSGTTQGTSSPGFMKGPDSGTATPAAHPVGRTTASPKELSAMLTAPNSGPPAAPSASSLSPRPDIQVAPSGIQDPHESPRVQNLQSPPFGSPGLFSGKLPISSFMQRGMQRGLEEIPDEAALELVKKEDPKQYEDLVSMKASNPEQFSRRLFHAKMKVLRERQLLEETRIQEQAEKTELLQTQISQKADEFQKETDSQKKDGLKNQLMELLSQDFDASLERQKLRLEGMKQRLERQEKNIQENEANKTKLLEERFENLTPLPDPMPQSASEEAVPVVTPPVEPRT